MFIVYKEVYYDFTFSHVEFIRVFNTERSAKRYILADDDKELFLGYCPGQLPTDT